MGYDTMGMLAFWFVNMTAINRVMEGTFITASDVGVVNSLSIFRQLDLFGFIPIPIPSRRVVS